MLTNLAEPVRDELLYSVLARTRQKLGPVIDSMFLQIAWGRRVDAFPMQMPRGIRRLLPLLRKEEVAAWVRGHTHFRYHAHWLGSTRAADLMERMLAPPPAGKSSGTEFSRGAAPWHRTLLFCPDCARDDEAAIGGACWRTHHQFPGTYFCVDHLRPLLASDVEVYSQRRLTTCPSGPLTGALAPSCPFDELTALNLARLGRDLNRLDAAPVDVARVQATLRGFLDAKGWLGRNGMARPGLLTAIENRYGSDKLALFGLRVVTPKGTHKIQSVWGRSPSPRGPSFWAVLLLDFLEVGAEEFSRAVSSGPTPRAARGARPLNPRPSVEARHKNALLDALWREPAPDRRELRDRVTRAYDYLRLNDPAWLDAVLPPRKRLSRTKDWRARDGELVGQVDAALERAKRRRSRQAPSFALVAAEMKERSTLFRESRRLAHTASRIRRLLRAETTAGQRGGDGDTSCPGRHAPARPGEVNSAPWAEESICAR